MGAGRIKGVIVEISGDTTKLQTALKGVNTEIRNTQSQLRDVEKLFVFRQVFFQKIGKKNSQS